MYYYYTVWHWEGDDAMEAGIYHTTWVSPLPPEEFLREKQLEYLREYRRFDTEAELEEFAKSVNLTTCPPTICRIRGVG